MKRWLLVLCALLLIIAFSILKGHYISNHFVNPDDIEVTATIKQFTNSNEYCSYFGLSSPLESDDKYIEPMSRTVHVLVDWSLTAEKRLANENMLYYSPYIIIIPPKDKWSYMGASHNYPSLYTVGSLPNKIIKNVLKDFSEYNWLNMETDRFGWVLQAKSFEQGFTDLALKSRTDLSIQTEPFYVFFVYYDPNLKKGWAKVVEANT